MSPSERIEFLEERRAGIGGSDIASLLQPLLPKDVKYGCRRRLWYQKSDVEPDYEQDDTGPMQLGRILEPHIARWHSEATGDALSEPSLIKHPEHPELLVHIDRIVVDKDHDKPGAAEIKALGPDMYWQTKREGIIVDYLLQLQHGMLCAGLGWGKFIIGNRAYGGRPLHWSHNKDKDIHAAILDEGPAFWKTLRDDSKIPDRLEPDDRRCGACQWRRTCQGNALVHDDGNDKNDLPYAEDIRPLLMQYDEVMEKFTEKLPDGSKGTVDDLRLAEVKEELRARLGDRAAVAVAWSSKDRKIYFRAQDGKVSWKMDDLLKVYDEMRAALKSDPEADTKFPDAGKFKRQGTPFRVLRIY